VWDFTIEAKQGTYNTGARDFYVYCFNPPTDTVKAVTLNGVSAAAGGRLQQRDAGLEDDGGGPHRRQAAGHRRGGGAAGELGQLVNDSVQLTTPAYNVPETSAFVRVYVARSGDATGSVSATYATFNGTALAGLDYLATNGTLQWGAGDLSDKFFDVWLVDDNGVPWRPRVPGPAHG
jgi:hypothetical protein